MPSTTVLGVRLRVEDAERLRRLVAPVGGLRPFLERLLRATEAGRGRRGQMATANSPKAAQGRRAIATPVPEGKPAPCDLLDLALQILAKQRREGLAPAAQDPKQDRPAILSSPAAFDRRKQRHGGLEATSRPAGGR